MTWNCLLIENDRLVTKISFVFIVEMGCENCREVENLCGSYSTCNEKKVMVFTICATKPPEMCGCEDFE